MNDDFPDTIQTTTTVTSSTTIDGYRTTSNQGSGNTRVTVDRVYLRSLPSILHIVQIILGFFYWVILCAVLWFAVGFMITVGITTWIWTIGYFIVFLLSINKKIQFIAWELSELIGNFVSAVLYFVAAIITSVKAGQANQTTEHGKLVFCTLLAWTLLLLYVGSTLLSFRVFLASRNRSSSQRTATTTTTATDINTAGAGGYTETKDPYGPPPDYNES